MTQERRLDQVAGQLGPRELVCLWLQEVHAYGNLGAYAATLLGQPDDAYPLIRLTREAQATTRARRKGKPGAEVEAAVRQARRDVLFLAYVHQEWNHALVDLEEVRRLEVRLLIEELRDLLRWRFLSDDLTRALEYLSLVTIGEGDLESSGDAGARPKARKRRTSPASPVAAILQQWIITSPGAKAGKETQRTTPAGDSFSERVLRWQRDADEELALLRHLRATGRTLGRQYFAGLDPSCPDQAGFLALAEEVLGDLRSLSDEGLVVEGREGDAATSTKDTLPSPEEMVRRQLGTPAEHAAYFADLARARTLQALGDRVGAARYVEAYLDFAR